MNQPLKDKLCKAIHTVLKRSAGRDPVDVAERIGDAVELIVDMETEEVGISGVPLELRDVETFKDSWGVSQPSPDKLRKIDIPQARGAVEPADPSAKRMLVVPGDPEFNQTKPADLEKKKTISAVDFKRKPGRPGANLAEVQHWDYADLTKAVLDNTPESVEFDVEAPQGIVKLKCLRNTHCQIGMGNVLLTYKHPQVSDNVTGRVTVDLVAKHPFSMYSKDIDIEKAMADIMVQLRGMYRMRPDTMEPSSGPEPGALRLDMNTQPGDHYGSAMEPGAVMVQDPRSVVRDQLRRSNDALAPVGRRFS